MISILNKVQAAIRKDARYIGIALTCATALLFAIDAMMGVDWGEASSILTGFVVFFFVLGLGVALFFALLQDNKKAIIVAGALALGYFSISTVRSFLFFPFAQGLIAYNIFRMIEVFSFLGALVLLVLGALLPKFEKFASLRLLCMAGFVGTNFVSTITLFVLSAVYGQPVWLLTAFEFLLVALDLFVGYVYFFGEPLEEPVPKAKPVEEEPEEEKEEKPLEIEEENVEEEEKPQNEPEEEAPEDIEDTSEEEPKE